MPCLTRLAGSQSPRATYARIYVLPLLTILTSKVGAETAVWLLAPTHVGVQSQPPPRAVPLVRALAS